MAASVGINALYAWVRLLEAKLKVQCLAKDVVEHFCDCLLSTSPIPRH